MILVTAEIVSNLIEVTAEIVLQVINVGAGGTINIYADNELQQTIVSPNLNAEIININF
jgi:hypothetical protein